MYRPLSMKVRKTNRQYCEFTISGRLSMDRAHFRECLREMLSEMFGTDTVTETIRGEKLDLVVSEKAITVDLVTLVARIFLFACQAKLKVCSVICIMFFSGSEM